MEKNQKGVITEEEQIQLKPSDVVNINIGIQGHVDSGKTTLCKGLTNIESTASFDKNPQSQAQGITIDQGFSAFFTHIPESLKDKCDKDKKYLQYTLVDCPGHASLIKTIIAGASIIDQMLLVIDITKGVQLQTAECIILGELLGPKLIVVLNKVDLIPAEKREQTITKKIENLKKLFQKTIFAKSQKEIKFICVSGQEALENTSNEKIVNQKNEIIKETEIIPKDLTLKFYMLIDHCFGIKGKGTVVTGTVIQGSAKPNDDIEFCELGETKKIKSMQMFKKPIDFVKCGDRCALLVPNLDKSKIERTVITSPNTLKASNLIIGRIQGVRYHKFPIKSKSKFHQSIGNKTVIAKIFLFRNFSEKLKYGESDNKNIMNDANKAIMSVLFETVNEYVDMVDAQKAEDFKDTFVILFLEQEVFVQTESQFIGGKLDLNIEIKECRLAFSGQSIFQTKWDGVQRLEELLPLKVSRHKEKIGNIEKMVDDRTQLIKDMFKKETNISFFMDKDVIIKQFDIKGKIFASFGKTGKVKVQLNDPMDKDTFDKIVKAGCKVVLPYKKFINIK